MEKNKLNEEEEFKKISEVIPQLAVAIAPIMEDAELHISLTALGYLFSITAASCVKEGHLKEFFKREIKSMYLVAKDVQEKSKEWEKDD
jgi:hypothetical protein